MNNSTINNDAVCWLEAPATIQYGLSVYKRRGIVLPIFSILELDRRLVPMEVTAADYNDPVRWWL